MNVNNTKVFDKTSSNLSISYKSSQTTGLSSPPTPKKPQMRVKVSIKNIPNHLKGTTHTMEGKSTN